MGYAIKNSYVNIKIKEGKALTQNTIVGYN